MGCCEKNIFVLLKRIQGDNKIKRETEQTWVITLKFYAIKKLGGITRKTKQQQEFEKHNTM